MHARCTPKISHHLRSEEPADAGPNRIQKSSSNAGAFPTWPLLVVLAAGSTTARSADLLDGNEKPNAAVVGQGLG